MGKDGTYCENDGNCKSHNCNKRRCEPKEEKVEKKPSGGGRTTEAPEKRPPVATRSKVVLDACGKDLRATVYADDSDGAFAEENDQDSADLCARYSADTIAKAKALLAGSYGIGFTDTCREIEGKLDADIACGKKAFDALPAGEARDVPFKIPVGCSGTQTKAEVGRCVNDLASIKVSSSVAMKMCTTYSTETIAKAKRIVANGYQHDFAALCRNVDWQTDEELACAQKYLTELFPDDPNGYEFRVPAECDAPLKKK